MAVWDSLLNYSKEHSQGVIVSLVGVIAVGTVGGGLWIQSLKSALTETEKLKNERIEIISEKHERAVEVLQQDFDMLRRRLSELESTFYTYQDTLSVLVTIILQTEGIQQDVKQRLMFLYEEFSKESWRFQRENESARIWSEPPGAKPPAAAPSYVLFSSVLILMVVLCAIIFASLLILRVIQRQRKSDQ